MLGGESEYPYASRDELTGQLPYLRKKYPDYLGYAKATLSVLFRAEELQKMQQKKATEFRAGILENTKKGLVFMPLPVQAQF